MDRRAGGQECPSLLPAATTLPRPRWPFAFLVCAGLLGAAGVGVGAAAAHLRGSDAARTASDFLLFHAAAIVGLCGVALAIARTSAVLVAALSLLTVGSVLFGGELAMAGLFDVRPLPVAAPTGGLCLIGGWLLLAVAAASLGRRRLG